MQAIAWSIYQPDRARELAELAVADMEFLPGEPVEDRKLKLRALAIYNSRLTQRERRKELVLSNDSGVT